MIYLDCAATTPVAADVLSAMLPYFSEKFGNPSALYEPGMAAREAVELARATIAASIGADASEVVFTSGGTEADNAAIRGSAACARGRHILTTPIEHAAVLETCEALGECGCEIEHLPVNGCGLVDPADVSARLRPDTALVSVMHANNEIGTIEPIAEIARICRERGVTMHTDAVQTFGKLPIDVRETQVDLLSLSAHKICGPKGVGALYVRRGTRLRRSITGGGQEGGRRGGTLNVPAIVGLGKAAERAAAAMLAEGRRLSEMRTQFVAQLAAIPGVRLNGSASHTLPGIVNICIAGVDGEPLLLGLDAMGICASAGSACSAGSAEPSHVLLAVGIDRETARGAVRFSMGAHTTADELATTAAAVSQLTAELRQMSLA